MAKNKGDELANRKGGVGKSSAVYNLGAGLALERKKILLLDVDPQSDLSKMLGQHKPHDLLLTLTNAMNDVVSGATLRGPPEIMHHHEGFDFVPGSRSLSAVDADHQGLVHVGLCACPCPGGLSGGGEHGGACRDGAKHQAADQPINPKLKICGTFFLDDFRKE